MEQEACESEHVADCAGVAISGLMGLADLLERGEDKRTADALRTLTLELDQQVGHLLALVPT